MPRRTDIHSILVIGAGPIVIGQACEFDYSGMQACVALREENYRIILINSNPATIMTDPGVADATYIEPICPEVVEKIIHKERPDALLPTMGGQTALNCALELVQRGVLEQYGVELIGVTPESIRKAEDRQLFQETIRSIGLATPRSGLARSLEEAWEIIERIGFPAIVRPSFTLGGAGGGIAYNREEYESICTNGLAISPTQSLLIDESIIGWKEYETEVVCDEAGNALIVCCIENVDPMGVHTGDSVTVAPAQTLTDKEYQFLREASIAIVRAIGLKNGGANVQFAVDPKNGCVMVVEMNPRVSRSSALASKATGFPIAKIAAKLAVGYRLSELSNTMTDKKIPAAFEPTLDYVVTKIPRFNFEKFAGSSSVLTTQMKSVGEVMGIGRCFQESLQKALRSLEIGIDGLEPFLQSHEEKEVRIAKVQEGLRIPSSDRLRWVAEACRQGFSIEEIFVLTKIDPWFLNQIAELVEIESRVQASTLDRLSRESVYFLKRKGFADRYLARLLSVKESAFRAYRQKLGVRPAYKRIDTCAAEFPTQASYQYSTYEQYSESVTDNNKKKIVILGGGPNRIGQGIEFDYCCVHAAIALREKGYETIMINCNPETISTDYDISDKLYFEPLTLEDVLSVLDREKPLGVMVQYGGQTPLKLAAQLEKCGVPIIGTSPSAIARAEDREKFQQLVEFLQLKQPPSGIVRNQEEGLRLAKVFAYPLIVRPSYVLGGSAMQVISNEAEFCQYMQENRHITPDSPLLLDHFLDEATEVDVEAVCDGKQVLVAGILEHIEQAGVHSGDSSCTLPPHTLDKALQARIVEIMEKLALELQVVGLMNAQFAVQKDIIYILEVNPRASRTVPFVAKATGVSLAKVAALCMVGFSLQEQGLSSMAPLNYFSVKKPVFPFQRFPGSDPILGPEMRSTGEVMGIGLTYGEAFLKSQLAASQPIPTTGKVLFSVRDEDKEKATEIARIFFERGFTLVATQGTALVIRAAGLPCTIVNKMTEERPHIVDIIKNGEIDFIVNTTEGRRAIVDSCEIRRTAVQKNVCYTTTIAGAEAAAAALSFEGMGNIVCLQELHGE